MYIKKLELLNFQIIKDFRAEFDGNIYFITGDNELGKSTLLKAIGALLTGERDEVLKQGETKGFAKMVVGDDGEEFDVSLSFTANNPRGTLTIKQKTTGMQTNNVTMLQKIFGYQDFDAVEFSRWSETAEGRRKQIAVVKNLLPEEVRERIEQLDADVARMKTERLGLNRDCKTMEAVVKNASELLEPGDVEKYSEAVDVTELMAQQAAAVRLEEKAKTVRAALEQRTAQLKEIPARMREADDTFTQKKAQIEESVAAAKAAYDKAVADAKADREAWEQAHAKEIAHIEEERKDFEARKENAEKWLKDYEAVSVNNLALVEKLANVTEHNRKNAVVRDFLSKKESLAEVQKKQEAIEAAIIKSADERAKLIVSSELPIEGLTFTEDGLELNGVPFVPGKVSDSQIMETATRLVIASNPKVKVFRIARGESLGEKRLESIVAIAKKYGFQGFIEQVQRGQTEMMIEEYTEKEE